MDTFFIGMWVSIGLMIVATISLILSSRYMTQKTKKSERGKSEEYGALKKQVDKIEQEISDSNHGLSALLAAISTMRINCASVTSKFAEQLLTLHKARNENQKKTGSKGR